MSCPISTPMLKAMRLGRSPSGEMFVIDDLRRQAKAVQKAEYQSGDLGIRLDTEPELESPEVVERLVDDREADDRIDDKGV